MTEQTESVRILIDAEDKATAKVRAVTEDIKENTRVVREGGTAIKDAGSIAASFGASGVGDFASEIGGLTERFRMFNSMQKKGKLANLAFRGSLIATAGVIGFKVGQALSGMISQVKKWNEEMESAAEGFKRMSSEFSSISANSLSNKKSQINLLGSPDERQAAKHALVLETENSLKAVRDRIKSHTDQVESMESYFTLLGWGSSSEEDAVARARLDGEKELLKRLEATKTGLANYKTEAQSVLKIEMERQQVESSGAAYVAQLQEQVDLLGATKDELNIIAAINATGTKRQASQAIGLMRELDAFEAKKKAEIDAVKAKDDADKKAKSHADKMLAIAKQIQAEKKRTLEGEKKQTEALVSRLLVIKDGKQAADAAKLQTQGLAGGLANRLSALLNPETSKGSGSTGPLNSRQSRFVSGKADAARQTRAQQEAARRAKEAADRKKEASDLIEVMREIRDEIGGEIAILGT